MEAAQVAHIYALCKPDGSRCYVGSTLGKLSHRLTRHKWRAATDERPHSRLYRFMNELGVDLFKIELIATVPLEERFITEALHIRQSDGILNRQVPGRTQNQRRAEARLARVALEHHLAVLLEGALDEH